MIIVLLASVTVATRWRCSADPGASPRWAASSKSEPNRVLEPLRIDPTRSCCRQIGANARVFKRNGRWSRCPYRDSAADHTMRVLNDVRTADSEQSSQPARPASPASALGVKRRSPVGLGLRRRGPAREAEQQQLRLGARSVRHGHHHADGRFGVWRRGTAGQVVKIRKERRKFFWTCEAFSKEARIETDAGPLRVSRSRRRRRDRSTCAATSVLHAFAQAHRRFEYQARTVIVGAAGSGSEPERVRLADSPRRKPVPRATRQSVATASQEASAVRLPE